MILRPFGMSARSCSTQAGTLNGSSEGGITRSTFRGPRLLDTGRYAERKLGRWNNAIDLSREIITSMHNRRAPAVEIAKAAFNCYEPLLQLGRTDDSLALLKKCRHEFQQANDVKGLGMAMSALADVEDKRGHGDAAIALVRDALR